MKFSKIFYLYTITIIISIFILGCGGSSDNENISKPTNDQNHIKKLSIYSSYKIKRGISKIDFSSKRDIVATIYENSLKIIDLKNIKSPYQISELKLNEFDFYPIEILFSKDSSKIYILGKVEAFRKRDRYNFYTIFDIVDIKDQKNPFIISETILEEEGSSLYISKNEKKAYIAINSQSKNSPKILIFDIQNPFDPILTESFKISHPSFHTVFDKNEEFIYISEGVFGLEVFQNQNKISSFNFGGSTKHIQIKNNDTLFISTLDEGVKIVKKDTNNSFILKSSINPLYLDKAFNTTLFDKNEKICISGGYSGIIITDITNIAEPKIIAKSDFNQTVRILECKVSNDNKIAVLADSKNGIEIVNLEK